MREGGVDAPAGGKSDGFRAKEGKRETEERRSGTVRRKREGGGG